MAIVADNNSQAKEEEATGVESQLRRMNSEVEELEGRIEELSEILNPVLLVDNSEDESTEARSNEDECPRAQHLYNINLRIQAAKVEIDMLKKQFDG